MRGNQAVVKGASRREATATVGAGSITREVTVSEIAPELRGAVAALQSLEIAQPVQITILPATGCRRRKIRNEVTAGRRGKSAIAGRAIRDSGVPKTSHQRERVARRPPVTPRVRGTVLAQRRTAFGDRVIPACAGNVVIRHAARYLRIAKTTRLPSRGPHSGAATIAAAPSSSNRAEEILKLDHATRGNETGRPP